MLLAKTTHASYYIDVGTVARERGFQISVYRETGERHNLPHCNIRWAGGSANYVINTDEPWLLNITKGQREIATMRELVKKYLSACREEWNRLNPGRKI